MSLVDSATGVSSGLQRVDTANKLEAAVARKSLDAQRTEGEALLNLIEKGSAPERTGAKDGVRGKYIDIYA